MWIPDFLALRTNSSHSPQETSWLQQRNVKPKMVLFHPQKKKENNSLPVAEMQFDQTICLTSHGWAVRHRTVKAGGLHWIGNLRSSQPHRPVTEWSAIHHRFYSIWIETNKNETAPSTQTVRWTRSPNASTHFISQRLYIGLDSIFRWKTNKQISMQQS